MALKPVVGGRIPHLGEIGHRQRSELWREQEMLAVGPVFGVLNGSIASANRSKVGRISRPPPITLTANTEAWVR